MHKYLTILFITLFSLPAAVSNSQSDKHFNFTDSSFTVGATTISACSAFSVTSWSLDYRYTEDCDSLISFLKNNPKLIVEIGVHTDSRPIPMTNDTLSAK